MQQLQWQGFYKKTIAERKSLVDLLFPDLPSPILSEQQGDFMIENFTTVAGLPLGLALNLVINGNELVVPMVVEEPSVVAAVSGIGKLVAQNGGFIANGPESNMVIAQIQLLDLNDIEIDDAIRLIQSNKQQILELGNKSCTSMVQRGGGFLDLETRKLLRSKPLQDTNFWLVIHLHINVCEAMGANCASTVAESISPYLKSLIKCRIGIRIVSNLIPSRMSSSKFKIRLDKLSYKGIPGKIVADRICEANDWARDDIYRAVTHNKGVMNGIDSVAVATGQDWRAIESSSHTYPFMFNGKYGPITNYEIVEQDRVGYLVGSINLPLQVGVKGGALNTNPLYKYTHRLLGNPTAKQLAMIMCTVGLAQNFAALRALVTEGIQRGHMKLHARNIAIAAGSPDHAVGECVSHMLKIDNISVKAAKEYLNCHIINSRIESLILNNASPVQSKPSIFYFQETLKMDNHDEFDKITLNVAFRTVGNKEPTTIIFSPESVFEQGSIKSKLFGEKSFTWISKVLSVLDSMTFKSKFAARDNVEQSRKLKVLSIMMNIVTRTLYEVFPDQVKALVNYIRDRTNSEEDLAISRLNRTFSGASLAESSSSFDPDTQKLLEKSRLFQPQTMALVTQLVTGTPDSQILALGLPLLLSLWQVFECQVRQTVGNDLLSKSLIEEQSIVIFSITTLKYSSFENFLLLTSKRLQVTLFLLCDAINFDDSKLNQQTMDKIKNIGLQLERLHSGSHDISKFRLERGIKRLIDGQNQSSQGIEYQFTNTNNTFLAWLQYQKHMNADTVIELHDNPNYVSTWKALVQEFWNQLPHSTGRNRIEFIAEDVLEKATAIYVDYYELNWY